MTFRWGWIAGAAFISSLALGNAYHLAPAGDMMAAVQIFAASVALLAALYCLLWWLRAQTLPDTESASSTILGVVCGIGILALAVGTIGAAEYEFNIKFSIALLKAVTALAALMVFLSFPPTQLFERATWACLVGLEGYSFIQYPLCKIAPGSYLDPALYFTWGEQTAKSACSRAFGPMMAYADVAICGAALLYVFWRWHRAGQLENGPPE